jgi:hypothetical protein
MRVALAVSSLTLVGLLTAGGLAGAQPEKSCRQQIEELCPDTAMNSPERRACVKQGIEKLSPRCQQRLGHRQAAPAQRPAGPIGLQGLVQACQKDHPRMVELCQSGKPQGTDPMPCLREHVSEFSEPCQKWIRDADEVASKKQQAGAQPTGAAAPAGAVKPASAAKPPAPKPAPAPQ